MALPVFFSLQIDSSGFITLDEDTSRHIVQVLRMKPGESLQLTDGMGNLATVVITDDHKKKCTVNIIQQTCQPKPARQVSIAISLLKNTNRFEWFLEKVTEIGVSEIVPLLCDHTEKQHFRYERMKGILVAAMLQSQQTWLPVLHKPIPFNQAVEQTTSALKLIAHCENSNKQSIYKIAQSSTQILIGPEGDFSSEEIAFALQQKYLPVTLGSTRLRAETAGVAAAVLLCI